MTDIFVAPRLNRLSAEDEQRLAGRPLVPEAFPEKAVVCSDGIEAEPIRIVFRQILLRQPLEALSIRTCVNEWTEPRISGDAIHQLEGRSSFISDFRRDFS